jgi:4,5-DOPA dioxygenase extradiol
MPLLFAGHGSPMNAIEDNEFSRGWASMVNGIPVPSAILCISAHWETNGTFITAMEKPRTIHDFYGFPDALYAVRYPAPGDPALAVSTQHLTDAGVISPDTHWGLDHGTWSVLRHMFPDASVPVLQVSLDYSKNPREHYELAQQLAPLRDQGVLVIGSGNLVHNLRMIDWNKPGNGFDWAESAEEQFRTRITQDDPTWLYKPHAISSETALAIPTPEHFLPLLYILGMRRKGEQIRYYNDKRMYGSLSMTSLLIS